MNAPDHDLQWQDEILQILYWMQGEHLSQDVTRDQLYRLLHLDPAQVEIALRQLLVLGWIQAGAKADDRNPSFRLTARGMVEGKRRFLDEFSSYLGKESHIECGEPNCDCHAPDWDGTCHTSETR